MVGKVKCGCNFDTFINSLLNDWGSFARVTILHESKKKIEKKTLKEIFKKQKISH